MDEATAIFACKGQHMCPFDGTRSNRIALGYTCWIPRFGWNTPVIRITSVQGLTSFYYPLTEAPFPKEIFYDSHLIVILFSGSAPTAGIRINNITNDGVINITETRLRGTWTAQGIAFPIAITICRDNHPPNFTISTNVVYRRR